MSKTISIVERPNLSGNEYGINDIDHLETREAMRSRIQMYLGSDDTEGAYQALKEIINNSTDEALAGYGDRIEITLDKNNQISVRDLGRGVPFGEKDGRNILVAIYTESHTGGKFGKGAYKNSSGLNGIGGTAVCMSSSIFSVTSFRDGTAAKAEFKEGNLIQYNESKTKEPNGTLITFIPDKKVFQNMEEEYSYEKICDEIKNISYLNKKIHFIVVDKINNRKQEFYSENGIADFIKDKVKQPLMKAPIIVSKSDGVDEIEIAFMWTNDSYQEYVFVNGLYCPEGGAPVTGAKTTITTSIKRLSGKDFSPDLIRRGLVYAINCKVANPSFANQTKSKINNPSLRKLASDAFKEGLEEFSHTSDFNSMIDFMSRIAKAEQAAEKAYKSELESNKEIEKGLKKKVVLAEKLADCRKHDASSQLMICEGKSAKGALVKARNSDTTACFDLRGKLINTLKNDADKVSNNEEIRQLHIALGCGLGNKFNINKLRYGKIVIMADMDKDGYDIACLVLTFFYTMYPQLLKVGKVYWGVTPLFKVVTKNKTYFAYDEEELKKLPKGDVTRLKGLGESQPSDFRETIFSPDARMVQMTMNDGAEAAKYFDILLGTNIEERRKYIFANADFENLED